jgi:glycosyltransferase involved in cell wall biosynthesis/peptidoglycan/xylan/chitin deacetylase (PgdA/CDA1 family)
MRLAFVIDAVHPFNKGGRERRLWEITRRLARDGYDVHVYTMKWWPGPSTIELDGVSLHAICRLYPLYHGTRRSMIQALLFGLATLKLLTKRFDALDVDHMPYFPLFSAGLVCFLRGKRLTATWHEVWGREYWASYIGRSARLAYLVERCSARMPHQIISVSQQTSERLREHLEVTCPILTVPLGVDVEGIDAAAPSHVTTDVLFAGRLLAHKNVDILIRAVAIAADGRPGLRCTIVGEGPERLALERLAGDLGVSEGVRFVGFLPNDELYSTMKSSGVFVLPSDREGFGLVLLEASTCGLPVITVRHPNNAARHLVLEGKNGFLAALGAADIARVILLALSQRETMDPRAATEEAGLSLDWDSVARSVANALLEAAGDAAVSQDKSRRSAFSSVFPSRSSGTVRASSKGHTHDLSGGSANVFGRLPASMDFAYSRFTMAVSNWRIRPTESEKRSHNMTDKILLTFDDSDDNDELLAILGVLRNYSVRAAFFIVGNWSEANQEALQAIIDGGHWIGNHTYSHQNLGNCSDYEVRREIEKGPASTLLRPPFGAYDSRIRRIALELGYRICYWDIDSGDCRGLRPNAMRRRVIRALHPGACVLMHINGAHTLSVLPSLIEDIQESGYSLCSDGTEIQQ